MGAGTGGAGGAAAPPTFRLGGRRAPNFQTGVRRPPPTLGKHFKASFLYHVKEK